MVMAARSKSASTCTTPVHLYSRLTESPSQEKSTKMSSQVDDQNALSGVEFLMPPQCQLVIKISSEMATPLHDQACRSQLPITRATMSPWARRSVGASV